MSNSKYTQVSITILPEDLAEIQAEAERVDRSVSSLIRTYTLAEIRRRRKLHEQDELTHEPEHRVAA